MGSLAQLGQLQYNLWGVTPTDLWDWVSLKETIACTGLRNSLLVAPMPTASTSQILGYNECFEPYTRYYYFLVSLISMYINYFPLATFTLTVSLLANSKLSAPGSSASSLNSVSGTTPWRTWSLHTTAPSKISPLYLTTSRQSTKLSGRSHKRRCWISLQIGVPSSARARAWTFICKARCSVSWWACISMGGRRGWRQGCITSAQGQRCRLSSSQLTRVCWTAWNSRQPMQIWHVLLLLPPLSMAQKPSHASYCLHVLLSEHQHGWWFHWNLIVRHL